MASTTKRRGCRRAAAAAALLLSAARTATVAAAASGGSRATVGQDLLIRARKALDLSNLFGSVTSAPSYDRIASQPVFAVTTPWGSPYLIYDKVDPEDGAPGGGEASSEANFGDALGPAQEQAQVVLYFADPQDAAAHRDEMLQLEQMKGADMRVMATSLGRAVRQASNLCGGLPTGQPVDPLTGSLPDDSGTLRYKIVPPKRELFYAARCRGRERVGLFGRSASSDASVFSSGRRAVGDYVGRLRGERETRMKTRRGREEAMSDPRRRVSGHMEGALGVPVFHCPGLVRRHGAVKRAANPSARGPETPLFFSYEDLVEAWTAMRGEESDDGRRARMPTSPPAVEVFNLMDVVTSIDRDQWRSRRRARMALEGRVEPVLRILGSVPGIKKFVTRGGDDDDAAAGARKVKAGKNFRASALKQVTFVPSSQNVAFKEKISAVGNTKTRIKNMKVWGREMM